MIIFRPMHRANGILVFLKLNLSIHQKKHARNIPHKKLISWKINTDDISSQISDYFSKTHLLSCKAWFLSQGVLFRQLVGRYCSCPLRKANFEIGNSKKTIARTLPECRAVLVCATCVLCMKCLKGDSSYGAPGLSRLGFSVLPRSARFSFG